MTNHTRYNASFAATGLVLLALTLNCAPSGRAGFLACVPEREPREEPEPAPDVEDVREGYSPGWHSCDVHRHLACPDRREICLEMAHSRQRVDADTGMEIAGEFRSAGATNICVRGCNTEADCDDGWPCNIEAGSICWPDDIPSDERYSVEFKGYADIGEPCADTGCGRGYCNDDAVCVQDCANRYQCIAEGATCAAGTCTY